MRGRPRGRRRLMRPEGEGEAPPARRCADAGAPDRAGGADAFAGRAAPRSRPDRGGSTPAQRPGERARLRRSPGRGRVRRRRPLRRCRRRRLQDRRPRRFAAGAGHAAQLSRGISVSFFPVIPSRSPPFLSFLACGLGRNDRNDGMTGWGDGGRNGRGRPVHTERGRRTGTGGPGNSGAPPAWRRFCIRPMPAGALPPDDGFRVGRADAAPVSALQPLTRSGRSVGRSTRRPAGCST